MSFFRKAGIAALFLAGWCVSAAIAQIVINPPAADIHINGHTYTNNDWQSNPSGTLSAIANDVGQVTQAYPQGKFSPRVILTSDLTMYVSPTGSNSNNCLVGNPCLTAQHALDLLRDKYDLAGFTVTIQIADGTYSIATIYVPAALVGQVGPDKLIIQGNAGTPRNVVLTSADITVAPDETGSAVKAAYTGSFTIKDLRIDNCAGSALYAYRGGLIQYQNIEFGTMGQYHLLANQGGIIYATGNSAITGNAIAHYQAIAGGIIIASQTFTSWTLSVFGTPNFSWFAGAAYTSFIYAPMINFVGPATGQRFSVNRDSVISTSGRGANYFPGNATGLTDTSTGGVYD